MKYQNAAEILPEKLLQELQEYINGDILYIPSVTHRKKWGSGNGTKHFYEERNQRIREAFSKGVTIKELSAQYSLAESTIKKIVY